MTTRKITTTSLPAPTDLRPSALQTDAAASYIGVSRKTLANWRVLGEGPGYVRLGKAGSRVVYRVADLDAFLAARVVGTVAA
ncbi:helix-turn-helix transcriptional regulator [Frondihabitans australicus]|uniref:Helix-turn-helix protein n=1 Tax=Frondihabitans australicus TaxID=386892 RepID=A0A495IFN6_9MICO|nr:helix-turn-helix domain-containing protein [Frondihabitans australicus]RKR74754.1 helix-turn-helix protein [Frondihabitans australicus]